MAPIRPQLQAIIFFTKRQVRDFLDVSFKFPMDKYLDWCSVQYSCSSYSGKKRKLKSSKTTATELRWVALQGLRQTTRPQEIGSDLIEECMPNYEYEKLAKDRFKKKFLHDVSSICCKIGSISRKPLGDWTWNLSKGQLTRGELCWVRVVLLPSFLCFSIKPHPLDVTDSHHGPCDLFTNFAQSQSDVAQIESEGQS